jgi:hypothetical protein
MRIIHLSILAAALLAAPVAAQTVTVPVKLDPAVGGAQSGRILVFAHKVDPADKPSDSVDTTEFHPSDTAIAAREVDALQPGATATVDAETDTYPAAFSSLPAGTYRFQAVLDRNHDYNYSGRGAGDIVSPVVEAALPGPVPVLTLGTVVPEKTLDSVLAGLPADRAAQYRQSLSGLRAVDFVSPALSAFWGRPVHIRGWVALPPGYKDGGQRFPTVYSTGGYGSTLMYAQLSAAGMAGLMAKGDAPPMIWVFLDQGTPTGTHEFADSANNGPWGQALTSEFIPWIEHQYAMDAVPSSRFLTGHSSGGWATLWLQVRYPAVFGGSWPTSPDPSDFHDFTGVDLYAPGANAYRDAKGEARPIFRDHAKLVATLEQFARMEAVLGAYGGQMASFDWVFSPKGADGRPVPMFDRATGKVDPDVVAYWHDHYDVAHIVARDWTKLKPDLDGKIHLYVGTADSFYLDGAAHRLQAVFQGLGAHEDFTFVPDKTHFDLFAVGTDRQALLKTIAWDMYAKARPGTTRPPVAPQP